MASASGAWALQILEATDHAELTAEISARAVNRIALDGDRVSRVIQAPSALTVEHDPVRGDVYLIAGRSVQAAPDPVTLYLGSERGFTYRLTLTVADRDPAQILIRNAAVAGASDGRGGTHGSGSNVDGRVGELVALIRAVARREPPLGYAIAAEPAADADLSTFVPVEIWRGPRWTARVFAHGNVLAHGGSDVVDAAALAEAAGPDAVAAWVSPPAGTADGSPAGGRLMAGGRIAVVVEPSPEADR